jgi:diguanylate cyclase (GGDEF)-like protein/PAS domain S-box-containing protein
VCALAACNVLVICERQPDGDALLAAIEGVLDGHARCHPVRNRDAFDRELLRLDFYDAIILGADHGWAHGLSLLAEIVRFRSEIPVIMVTDSNGVDLVAEGFRLGMRDFLRSSQLDRLPALIDRLPDDEQSDDQPSEVDSDTQVHIDRYNAISSVLPDYVYSFYLTTDGDIQTEWRSDGVWTLSGYTPEEIQETGWLAVVHPEDQELVRGRLENLREGKSSVIEYRIIHRSGEIRWLRDYSQPIWDERDKRFNRFAGASQDITHERVSDILRSGQTRILELIATGAPIPQVSDAVLDLFAQSDQGVDWVVHQFRDSDETLHCVSCRDLAAQIHPADEVLDARSQQTVQASAVSSNQMIVVPNVTGEELWNDQMAALAEAGVRSVVVLPISARKHRNLGTVTVYRTRPGEPPGPELERVTIGARLIGMALSRDEAERTLIRAQTHYRRLAEEIPAVIFIAKTEPDLPLTYLSPQAAGVVAQSLLSQMPGVSLLELIHPDDRPTVSRMFANTGSMSPATQVEFRTDSQIEERWLQCSATVIENPGEERCWQGVLLDVTSRRQAEHMLQRSQVEFRSLFDNNPNLVFSLDTRGRLQRVNKATSELTGYRPDDLLGRPFTSLLVAGEVERVWHHFRGSLSGESQRCEAEVFTRDGNRARLNITMIPYAMGQMVTGISVIAEDVTERVAMENQLHQQAFHDSLTGLPNRSMFNQRLGRALDTMHRTGHSIAVLFVDLDNFKVVNDSLGHESGDEYLRIVSETLRRCVGDADLVARFGGDEFTILLVYPDSDVNYPIRIAEWIGRDLGLPALLRGQEINTGVSVGVAIYKRGSKESEDLLRQADIALYQAKRGGPGVLYRVFEESMHDAIIQRLEIERDLRRAIRRNEFVAHYQPIIDLRTGQIVNVEALVRWNHPERGVLPPGAFLPVAEETGQVTAIDAMLLEMASAEIASWNRTHPEREPLKLAVNLSVKDFRKPDLVEQIGATLKAAGCDPRWLKFEITESTMMQDVDTALGVLQRLRKTGIGFAIDDFGTGYSSLSYLQRLPLDTLKIDRSFIDGLGGDDDDELMVQTIISLASALSLVVIAEGIETETQLDRARELGCDRAQGYLIARPAPFNEIIPLLDDQQWFSSQRKSS